jgi:hypothetical protein
LQILCLFIETATPEMNFVFLICDNSIIHPRDNTVFFANSTFKVKPQSKVNNKSVQIIELFLL